MFGSKILLTTYSTAFLTSGGGESELVQVAEILNKSGLQADIYGIGSRPLDYYEYVIHFSLHQDGESIIKEATKKQKKIILWPNVWWMNPPSISEVNRIFDLLESVKILIFKSKTELLHFNSYIQLKKTKCKYAVIPIGISDRFLLPVDNEVLSFFCDIKNYIICLGLIEPVKNQLRLIKALNILKKNALFIGGYRDNEYFNLCLKEAHSGIHFLPFVQPCSVFLRSAIANATLLAEPSFDPPGRSAIEGAFMGKPLVLSEGPWQREYFGDGAWYVNPTSEDSIADGIKSVLSDPNKEAIVNVTASLIRSKNSSNVVSQKLIETILEIS